MSEPNSPVECATHGTSHATFLCQHLLASVGAGFFTASDPADPRPDAWCARCDEVARVEHGWNDASEAFAGITVVCAGCYDVRRERNQWRPVAADLPRWRCHDCGEEHSGLPYDFGTDAPALTPEALAQAQLSADTCVAGEDRFVRACLELPILGGPGPLVYGVWVTLSPPNYQQFLAHRDQPRRYRDGPYFGWFSSALPHWPETLNLKTRVHLRPPPLRPVIELEPTRHPLAVAQREGISIERHRELALALLHGRQ